MYRQQYRHQSTNTETLLHAVTLTFLLEHLLHGVVGGLRVRRHRPRQRAVHVRAHELHVEPRGLARNKPTRDCDGQVSLCIAQFTREFCQESCCILINLIW